MYYRSVKYDVAFDVDGDIRTMHSWACGFIAHPASRSMYRQFPNLLESGDVVFELPGLPQLRAKLIERSAEIFGEDAALCEVSSIEGQGRFGAFAICLNGALVQMLCLEPTESEAEEDPGEAVRSIAESIQTRDPEFYGRGELNTHIVLSHVALTEDIKLVYPNVRLREDHYVFTQDDGVSDFWE